MSDVITFTLNATPTPQQRARHSSAHGFHRSYKTETQEANEDTLHALLLPHVPKKPLEGAVRVVFTAYMPIPARVSKKKRARLVELEKVPHIHRCDLDNIIKQLLDAMTRMKFWVDDGQVFKIQCEKVYSGTPRWEVCVERVTEYDEESI